MTRPLGAWNRDGAERGLQHEDRFCPTHGMGPWANWRTGAEDRKWECVACRRDYNAKRSESGYTRSPNRPEPKRGTTCPVCFNYIPLTGKCDNCDD